MKVGYLGPQGTFSEQAALIYQKRNGLHQAELVQFPSIIDVIEAVESGAVEEGVVPFENSIEGTVTSTIDTIIFDVNLFIKAEVILPVSQHLMIREGTDPKNLTKIISHPQGLAQTGKYLRVFYPQAEKFPSSSTAEAARIVAQSSKPWGAVAPERAAEVYGLKILQRDIQDDKENATRFVVLTKERPECVQKKTSFMFAIEHKPGELYRILDIISIWDLNMTKIESRPMKHKLGTYVFFVDLETENSKDLQDGLKMVERKATVFKYLGSYPVFHREEEA